MTANDIKDLLLKEFYPKGRKFCITNFAACGLEECDVLMVTEDHILYEYEIKCSYSDFKADFKKEHKHKKLSGFYEVNPTENGFGKYRREDYLKYGTAGCPNYFYYVCRENLIPIEEVPHYAGLIYINENNTIRIVKKGKKIHKLKATEKLIYQICRALTARMIYGCSYMNYKKKAS